MTRPVPSGQAVDAWWFSTRDVGLVPTELAELSAEERERAAALAFTADRRRYQAAHVLLRRVLAGYVGDSPGALRFGRQPCPRCGGPSGRPVLASGGPAAARPWFSLAHSGDAVLITVAGRPVGSDTEQDPAGCVCSLAGTMHPADARAVAGLPEPERHRAVIAWWVRTEAALKCTGEGIAHGLGGFPVLPPVVACPGPPVGGCVIGALPAPPGYHAAVALAGLGGAPQARIAVPGPGAGLPGRLQAQRPTDGGGGGA